ncbi:hypothetical protein [Aquimarina algiphila]|uniref:hypothetical protein n=1 Tax=Aquimarina algiphila TaxID=2047982 RepID=UPI00232CE7DF|nr:hypothetical protein [Aquimarina algiphila]
MKQIKIYSFTILSIYLLLIGKTIQASECYHYHTPHFYELFSENGKLVFQHTVKDPNRVSYVSRDKIILKNIDAENFKILEENEEFFLFTTAEGYFIAEKKENEIKEYGVSKIGDLEIISETVGVNFICKNNVWKYIVPKSYSAEFIEKVIAKMPGDLEVITNLPRKGLFMKNSQYVYLFNEEQLTFSVVPDLLGKTTQFVPITDRHQHGDSFLFDKDTFYRVGVHEIENMTLDFNTQQSGTTFDTLEIIQQESGISLDTKKGTIWIYRKGGVHLANNHNVHFVPIEASYLNEFKELIRYDNKVYKDMYYIINKQKPIDISVVKDIQNLHKETEYIYTDGIQKYVYDYDANKFSILPWLEGSSKYFTSINTYNFLGNNGIYVGISSIHFLSGNIPKKEAPRVSHTSRIKDLTLGYAYDDKLLIENKEIKNIADRESMLFLGSTVDVISGCDGGEGQYPVEIDVYYFFKDDKGIYSYNTYYPKKMRHLGHLKPEDYKEGNYDQLMQLMTETKEM